MSTIKEIIGLQPLLIDELDNEKLYKTPKDMSRTALKELVDLGMILRYNKAIDKQRFSINDKGNIFFSIVSQVSDEDVKFLKSDRILRFFDSILDGVTIWHALEYNINYSFKERFNSLVVDHKLTDKGRRIQNIIEKSREFCLEYLPKTILTDKPFYPGDTRSDRMLVYLIEYVNQFSYDNPLDESRSLTIINHAHNIIMTRENLLAEWKKLASTGLILLRRDKSKRYFVITEKFAKWHKYYALSSRKSDVDNSMSSMN